MQECDANLANVTTGTVFEASVDGVEAVRCSSSGVRPQKEHSQWWGVANTAANISAHFLNGKIVRGTNSLHTPCIGRDAFRFRGFVDTSVVSVMSHHMYGRIS